MSNTYEIIIKDETTKKTKGPIADNSNSASTQDAQKQALSERRENVGVYFATKRIIAPFVNQALQGSISTISLSTGANEQQQRIQFVYDTARQVYGMAESVAVGAAIGSLPGAIIGGITSLITGAIAIAQKQNVINLNRANENVALGLMNIRAGGTVAATNGSRSR